eukprot:3385041-Rhodomonas_salina.1
MEPGMLELEAAGCAPRLGPKTGRSLRVGGLCRTVNLCGWPKDVAALCLVRVHHVGVDHVARLAVQTFAPLLRLPLAVRLVRIEDHTRQQQQPGHDSASDGSANCHTVAGGVGDRG